MRFGQLALAAFLVVAASSSEAQNVLQNPGFESGTLAPWAQARTFNTISESWNVTSAVSHSGTYSATDVGNAELRQNFSPVATSQITEISFWAEHPNASVRNLAYDFFYVGGGDDEFFVNTSGTGFNQFNITANLRTNAMLSGISFFGNSGGRTYIDDVVVNGPAAPPVPEPGSVALLIGMGISGAGFLARRRKQMRK